MRAFLTRALDRRMNRVTPDELGAAISRREERVTQTIIDTDVVLPMLVVQRRLDLSVSECLVLWTLIGFELDADLRTQLRMLATEPSIGLTKGTLLTLVYQDLPEAAVIELGSESKLIARGLVETDRSEASHPLSQQRVRAAERVLELASGVIRLAPECARLARLEEPIELETLAIDTTVKERLAVHVRLDEALVVVGGASGSGRRSLLVACAQRAGRSVITIDARRLSRSDDRLATELRCLARECLVFDAVPLFTHLDTLGARAEQPSALALIDELFGGTVLATVSTAIVARWRRPTVAVELPTLTAAERERLWKRAIPSATSQDLAHLANTYPLAPSMITRVGANVASIRTAGQQLDAEEFQEALRAAVDNRFAGLATRSRVQRAWQDLVVSPDLDSAMRDLRARLTQRVTVYERWSLAVKVGKGLGTTALFSGPPGTGKTMAATALAAEVGLDLYQVDLSKIVSKWIGETEKQLAELFDAAESGHAILLFDEADALFGKRTAVQSSNDRHANQETNYLLQRIEAFTGTCILTTNHDNAIDEAFRRRIACHIRFPIPELAERERIWRSLLTDTVPIEPAIELGALAERYVMSGGYIRNAVVRAAFMAADRRVRVSDGILREAARLEYESMGKLSPR